MPRSDTRSCGLCGRPRVVPIVYGLPGMELAASAERGDVALGGCVVFPDAPERFCSDCGATWSPERGWVAAGGRANPRRRRSPEG